MNELNLGADWEQSKRLVIHWHDMWAKEKLKADFIIAYLNPADTSFRQMMDNFNELNDDDKKKILNLTQSLANIRRAVDEPRQRP